ncbi:MAG: hypothetical protein EOM91_16425 [Sphingobacteriia bacterium]|nr:hypothetical protein [Sphingobacteriia bacterium]NCC41205.1 hypothetical protein [Gammaproteobacteria bacterium]
MSTAQLRPASQDPSRRPTGPLLTIWSLFWNSIVRVIGRCAYASVATAGVVYLFLANDQGRDLLRLCAERGFALWNLAFLIGALLLGLTLWYTSRRLLEPEFSGRDFRRETSAFGRAWLPRVFGFLAPASIGVGFLLVDTQDWLSAWILGALFLLLAAGLMVFFIKRRSLFIDRSTSPRRERIGIEIAREGDLSAIDWAIIGFAFGLSAVLVASFLAWPVAVPRLLGSPAIVLLGFAGVALFGGLVLTYAFLVNKQPAGTALALVLAVLFGLVNDNHWIRTDPAAPELPRQTAADHYQTWRAANPTPVRIDGREPVILVAAAGGGIRAAYWTASTLSFMDEIEGFDDNLFAISGVSGGSVGATIYTALKRIELAQAPGVSEATTLETAREVLAADFLSPVIAGMLFPDLIQRFLPVPIALADRQRFLELGFEHGVPGALNPLALPFTALYADGYAARLPSLLLNTTVVDSGRRALISNIDPDGITDTADLLDERFSTRGVLLSAAAGASARFTYVSPAGSLSGPGDQGEQKVRLVDGGYFENSGAATLGGLLGLIESETRFPILILIRNDPRAPAVCQNRAPDAELVGAVPNPLGPPSPDLLSEVTSPIRALLNARDARGRLAEVDAARQFEGQLAGHVERRLKGAVIELSLAAVNQAALAKALSPVERRRIEQSMVEPPLGWSLSETARLTMDETLDHESGGLEAELDNLRALLAGDITAYRPCDPR